MTREIASRQCEHVAGGVRCKDPHERMLIVAGRRTRFCAAHWGGAREAMLRRHQDAMRSEALPCCCGSAAPTQYVIRNSDKGDRWRIQCPGCLAETPSVASRAAACFVWNVMQDAARGRG